MRRKTATLLICIALLILVFMGVRAALKPRYLAVGRVKVNGIDTPAAWKWWHYGSRLSVISNRFSENGILAGAVSGAILRDHDVAFAGVSDIRGTSLLEVYFVGNDESVVLNVTSNACALIVQFYPTSAAFPSPATNLITCEHWETGIRETKPFWRRMENEFESWFRR